MKKRNIYSQKELTELVKSQGVQLFFLCSPLPFPTFFASHCWMVINENGKLERWEVWQGADQCPTSWGHVHQNLFPPFLALHKNFFLRFLGRQSPRLVSLIEDQPLAGDMIRFIRKNAEDYTYWYKYRYHGPNSNTFIQWVIDQFPQCRVTLPASAIGKNVEVREEA